MIKGNKSTKSTENVCISVNRSRAICGFFTDFFVPQLVIGQQYFENIDLFIGKLVRFGRQCQYKHTSCRIADTCMLAMQVKILFQ